MRKANKKFVRRKVKNLIQPALMGGGGRETILFIIRLSQKFRSIYINGEGEQEEIYYIPNK